MKGSTSNLLGKRGEKFDFLSILHTKTQTSGQLDGRRTRMNNLKIPHILVGLALLVVTSSSAAIGEALPKQFSEEAVDVIPDIEYSYSCYGNEDDVAYSYAPQASCSDGLTERAFIVPPPFVEEFSQADIASYPDYPECSRSGEDATVSPEGITCIIDPDPSEEAAGTVRWTLTSPEPIPHMDDVLPTPPPPPAAISSVILENCQQGEGATNYTYNFLYGQFGATRDADLTMFVSTFHETEPFERIEPSFVTFCFDDSETPQTVVTAEVPVCEDTTVCPGGNEDETYLVEVSRLRGTNGEVLQPSSALDEETCVCNPVADKPLTQIDPAAIRDPGEGPGQVTRMDQWNGDPYFCTTLNGRRYCWAY